MGTVGAIAQVVNVGRFSQEDLLYTAGLFDGEGCISINTYKHPKMGSLPASVQVFIGNTNKEIIQWLHEKFGGKILFHKPKKPQHKDSYTWRMYNQEAVSFLENILPYLKIKRKQGELIFEYRKTFKFERHYFNYELDGKKFKGSSPVPIKLLEKRIELKKQLNQLNFRGVQWVQ